MLAKTPLPKKNKLTDAGVAKLPLAGSPGAPAGADQYVIRDTELAGFFVRVGRTTRTYTAQADAIIDGKRQTFRKQFGRADETTVVAARKAAEDWAIGVKRKSRLPDKKPPKSITLREAWAEYRLDLERRDRQPGTIEFYQAIIERGPLTGWLDVPLSGLGNDPPRLAKWHAKETEARGPYRANGGARTFSAIYNFARRTIDTKLPPPPTFTIRLNREERSKGGMGLEDLAAWGEQLRALPNPIRQEFHLMTLLTGSRPEALSKARWEQVDVRRRVLHIPEPKGGKRRAFDIPLSKPMLRALWRARRAGRFLHPNSAWIFPAASHEGHIKEWGEDRTQLSQWGRDLRKTFRTVAALLEVPELFSMALLNHAPEGVHNKYLVAAKLGKPIADAQSKISVAIIAGIDIKKPRTNQE